MFHIRAMGCDSEHDDKFHVIRESGYDCYLLLFAKTKAIFGTGSELISANPGTLILYNKFSYHEYGANGENYSDDWIQFDCSDSTIQLFRNIIGRPIHIGDTVRIDNYMHLVCDAYYGGRGERVCSTIITAMLEDISAAINDGERQSVHFSKLVELRQDIYRLPHQQWSIKAICSKLLLSEPYFQDLYKKTFGVSCFTDIINSRVEAAKNFLADTPLDMSEIAARCGYNNTVHFSRQFRKITGQSPREYRKSQRLK